jgi:hypothetical protein
MATHKVKLSNGQTVTLREQDDDLAIGHEEKDGEDWWICTISANGVLCAPNSGESPEQLTEGLVAAFLNEEPRT